MLSIRVEFLHDTYRADPDGGAITGQAEKGEWPPAPARLLAAFVAADGMGDACRVTDGSELAFLEGLGPPIIHAEASPHHQQLNERYVVEARKSAIATSTHQEYPARKGALVRPGVRTALRHATVHFVWNKAEPGRWLGGLRLRAARIGYLGCADSPVRLRVSTSLNDIGSRALHAFTPDTEGTCFVSVPRPGHHLAALKAAYDAWQEHGPAVGRPQFPALRNLVQYAGPDDVADQQQAGRVIAWLRLKPSLPGRRIADVTAALKAAVMSRYQRLHGDPLPLELHGHGFDGTGYEIARYLALPNVGYRYSDGRIHGAAVWLPNSCDDTTIKRTRTAARSIKTLQTANLNTEVAPWAGESRPAAARPRRWRRRSRAWTTAVPAIHERYGKLNIAEIQRWCRHAGLPEAVWFRSARVPLVPGALSLHPLEVQRADKRSRDRSKPYSHIEIRFEEPVPGPVVIGGGRSRGFGLCIPTDDRISASSATPRR